MEKKKRKKLTLHKETLRHLDNSEMSHLVGGEAVNHVLTNSPTDMTGMDGPPLQKHHRPDGYICDSIGPPLKHK